MNRLGRNVTRSFMGFSRGISPIPSSFNTMRYMATATTTTSGADPQTVNDLKYLKYDSNGSNRLYAVMKLHNIPYLVTKGDKIILPVKMKGVKVGDQLSINNVTTIGSPNFTFNIDSGIPSSLYNIKANVVEITKEPYYEVYRKKQRCRRLKTFPVQNYQTVLLINELNLK